MEHTQLSGAVHRAIENNVEKAARLKLVLVAEVVDSATQLRVRPLDLKQQQEEAIDPVHQRRHKAHRNEHEHFRRHVGGVVLPKLLEPGVVHGIPESESATGHACRVSDNTRHQHVRAAFGC
jgi:hypothetical protein